MDITGNQKAVSDVNTLLVLHHSNNTVGIVETVDAHGKIIDVGPGNKETNAVIRIDASEKKFMDFYADFYHRLKDPEDYSFFKVREFEAYEAAIGLQSYLAGSAAGEKEDLKQYEVSIEAVDALRNKKSPGDDCHDGKNGPGKESAFTDDHIQYRYQVEDVDWGKMAEMGLDLSVLQKLGALEPLLRGFKTPMLVPVRCDDGKEGDRVYARLRLKLDDNGEVAVQVHRAQKRVDFRKKFMGHRFSKEDRLNLLHSGNMGRVVELVDPVTGEVIPSLVSLDKLTHELFSLRMEFVRIPEVVCGVELSEGQREVLWSGKSLFVENMVSGNNRLFNATVQLNADKQGLDFFFNRKIAKDGVGFECCVPPAFRGLTLRRWQVEKLKAGESAYIRGLVSRKGKTYQGYIRFDKEAGTIVFLFKKPGQVITDQEVISKLM